VGDVRFVERVSDCVLDDEVGGHAYDGEHYQERQERDKGLSRHFGLDLPLQGLEVHRSPPKKSNLDATGMRIVRKGCVVEYPKSGCTARVVKVRLGQFWPAGKADGAPSFLPCSQVRVVA
jgi:hypothetical protein